MCPSWGWGAVGSPWVPMMGVGGFRDPLACGRGTDRTPAMPQSFQAALQTQWSWMLQLCCCIEAHLKENTAYFQVRTTNARLSCSVPPGAPRPLLQHAAPPCPTELTGKSSQARAGAALPGPSLTSSCCPSSSQMCGKPRNSCGSYRRRCAGSTPATAPSLSLASRTCCRMPR